MPDRPLMIVPPARQLAFHQLLVAARKTWLVDALSASLAQIDTHMLKEEISTYVPSDVQRILAQAGVRDEYVFPTPVVLQATPTLVGYYRLLLGAPQKGFYAGHTGVGRFRTMETRGTLTQAQTMGLPEFCAAMGISLAELVRQLSPSISRRDVEELPLLTLGAQFQGANNNIIGKRAAAGVFNAIADIVKRHVVRHTDQKIEIQNAAGRTVTIALASDPDVRIQEDFGSELRNLVAMEIKGGTDRSNAHNRAGEAEKSHQKAKGENYRDFWTLIATRGLDMSTLKSESPTTTTWFDVAEILAREGTHWRSFKSRLAGAAGIPLAD